MQFYFEWSIWRFLFIKNWWTSITLCGGRSNSYYYVVLRGVSHDGCHRRFHSALKSDRERRVGGVGTSFFSPYNFFPQYNTTTYKGKTTIQYTVHLARKKNLLFKIQWSWQTPIIARFVWKGKVTDTYFSVAFLTQTMLILVLQCCICLPAY